MGKRGSPGSWDPVESALQSLRRTYERAVDDIAKGRRAVAAVGASLNTSQRAFVAAELIALHEEHFPTRRRRGNAPQLYFIQREDGGPIKIGFSRNVTRRLAALQTAAATPLRLLATAPGGRSEEVSLHRRLAAHRLEGEWFDDCPAVQRVMASLSAQGG